MDSLSSVSPSIMLPPVRHHLNSFPPRNPNLPFLPSPFPFPTDFSLYAQQRRRRRRSVSVVHAKSISSSAGDGGLNGGSDDDDDVEVERALRLDGSIPGSSDEFVKQVSSRAYDIRRHLHQSFDSSSYDVLDDNPWRETPKPVYVLTQKENQLCTMKTRMNRSEVERELGLLFSKGRKFGNQTKQSRSGKKFKMVVEDVREGILVFEDENEAARYCDLMQGGGQGCEGVAEIEASSVFDICRKSRALAVLFRRGRTPPQPESLQLNLRARKRSLEED